MGPLMRLLAILSVVLTLWPLAVGAQGAPAALRGKSAIATWTEERVQRFGEEKDFTSRSYSMQLSVYVSSEGRVFAKRVVSNRNSGKRRGRQGSAESVGEGNGRGQAAQLSGRTVTVFSRFAEGARMARIDFDESFSSCQASVVLGHSDGRTIKGKSRIHRGTAVEIQSAKVTGTSCSIRAGNVFAE